MINGMGWCGSWFGTIFWLAILALLVWAVIAIVNKNRGQNQSGSITAGQSPLDILKKRYASGEITKEEFEKMKKDLQ